MLNYFFKRAIFAVITCSLFLGCGNKEGAKVEPRNMTDAIDSVIRAHRQVYTRLVIHRLGKEEGLISASENWQEDKTLLLPAQLLHETSKVLEEEGYDFSYSLISLWPINKKNRPKTSLEMEGLKFVRDNPSNNFYGEEKMLNTIYFTAIYPDNAVSQSCVECHNNHKRSPKKDFKLDDNMGAVVIRIPINVEG